jgi:erythritol kinase
MSTDVILALDAGTSLIKAVAFTTTGRMLGSTSRRNEYSETPGGAVEQDMRRTWDDACAVLAELVSQHRGNRVVALAITGQGDGTWLIDADNEPVAPAWLWLDSRAGTIIDALRASPAGRECYAHTGTGLAACQQSGQLLWLKRHRPEVLARAATAFHCKDWLYLNLTGARVTDPTEACFTFGDWRTRDYSDATLAALGLSDLRHLLPPIVDGVRTAHELTREAAERLGLPAGLPVVLGYVDVLCCGIGVGLYGGEVEAGVSILGSTGMHMRLARDASSVVPNAAQTGYSMVFPVQGTVAQMQSNMAATLNIDWVVDLARQALSLCGAARSREEVLTALDGSVADAPPGAAVFHPFISAAGERGPFTDVTARASLLGLERALGLPGLARTVYEGLGFAARDCFEAIGGAPAEIRIAGGAARSAAMRSILAAALDRPVRVVAQPEAGAAGAAMIAAMQLGLYPDMDACVADWVTPHLREICPPDPVLVPVYDSLFPICRDAYRALTPVWRRMHRSQETRHAA